jgi:hypothetical protein
MSRHLASEQIAEVAHVVAAPRPVHVVDRSFGLPARLYGLTIGAYLAFLGVMAAAFMTGQLAIPMAIFVFFVVMAFSVPGAWTRIGPDDGLRSPSWSSFRMHGLMTVDGPVSAHATTVQVLILPVAILCWGIAIAVIAALV